MFHAGLREVPLPCGKGHALCALLDPRVGSKCTALAAAMGCMSSLACLLAVNKQCVTRLCAAMRLNVGMFGSGG